MKSSTETLQAIKDMVHSFPPEVEAWLFGSRARGDARPDSDWDVLLLLNKDRDNITDAEFDYSYSLTCLGFDLDTEINPVIMTRRRWNQGRQVTPFYHYVTQDRIRL